MSRRSVFLISLTFSAVPLALASPIMYDVTVDTTSIDGTTGSLDFNFNPGPLVTQAADLQILDFTGGSFQDCAANIQGFCATGDVTGTLPGNLTFDNGTGFNDYFDGFTYGNALSFDVMLFGPALSAPDGTSTSGSAFAFSMFSDAAGTAPALTSNENEGFALTIDVNLDGSTTATNFSSETTVAAVTVATIPEPGSLALIGSSIALLVWIRRK